MCGGVCGEGRAAGVFVVCDATKLSLNVLWSVLADECVACGGGCTEEAGDGAVIAEDALGAEVWDANVLPILADDRLWASASSGGGAVGDATAARGVERHHGGTWGGGGIGTRAGEEAESVAREGVYYARRGAETGLSIEQKRIISAAPRHTGRQDVKGAKKTRATRPIAGVGGQKGAPTAQNLRCGTQLSLCPPFGDKTKLPPKYKIGRMW